MLKNLLCLIVLCPSLTAILHAELPCPPSLAITCGQDKVWHWATGRITAPNQVELSSPDVAAPVAVRFAWADNPVCNLFSDDGLPVTPFSTCGF